MPKIKRWFPVSHDINHSPTMRQLARDFGLAGWRVWFEILSIADRQGHDIDCTSEGALSRLTSAAETRMKVTKGVLEWLLKRNIVATIDGLNHVTRVVNYAEFHRTEERKPLPPDLPDLPDLPKEQKAADAAPVDKSPKVKELRPQTEADALVRLAAEIGKLDKVETRAATQKALIQWAISMLRKLDKEPQERKEAVVRASLEQVRAKLTSGYEITNLWGLLEVIFTKERAKYIQGPEHEANKKPISLQSVATIFDGMAKARGA